jgi:hypothetical protein
VLRDVFTGRQPLDARTLDSWRTLDRDVAVRARLSPHLLLVRFGLIALTARRLTDALVSSVVTLFAGWTWLSAKAAAEPEIAHRGPVQLIGI